MADIDIDEACIRRHGNIYGPINIRDSARAHLGDNYTFAEQVSIQEAFFIVQAAQGHEYVSSDTLNHRIASVRDTQSLEATLWEVEKELRLLGQLPIAKRLEAIRLHCLSKKQTWNIWNAPKQPALHPSIRAKCHHSTLRNASQEARSFPTILSSTTQATSRSLEETMKAMSRMMPANLVFRGKNRVVQVGIEDQPALSVLDSWTIPSSLLPTAFLLALVCRSINMSMAELYAVLTRIRSDPLFPLTTFLLGYWISKLWNQSSILMNPSELTGDCLIFEDFFGVTREVPTSYFTTKELGEGFFTTHYPESMAGLITDRFGYRLEFEGKNTSLEKLVLERDRLARTYVVMIAKVRIQGGGDGYTCLMCKAELDKPRNMWSPRDARRDWCGSCGRKYRMSVYHRPYRHPRSLSTIRSSRFEAESWQRNSVLCKMFYAGTLQHVSITLEFQDTMCSAHFRLRNELWLTADCM